MKVEYTIPLWGIIAIVIPLIIALITGAIRMVYKQSDHEKELKLLKANQIETAKRIDELEEDVEDRHDQLYKKIEVLDSKFSDHRLILVAIETKMDLILNQKLKFNESN